MRTTGSYVDLAMTMEREVHRVFGRYGLKVRGGGRWRTVHPWEILEGVNPKAPAIPIAMRITMVSTWVPTPPPG